MTIAFLDPLKKTLRVSKAAPLPVETLGIPTVPRQVPATVSVANQVLTATCTRVSIRARGAPIRYLTTGAADASTSHYIAQDERLSFSVLPGTTISVIRSATAVADGVLEITELA